MALSVLSPAFERSKKLAIAKSLNLFQSFAQHQVNKQLIAFFIQ
jgi:hypothetical protein